MTSDYIITLYTKKGAKFTMILNVENDADLTTLMTILLRNYAKITIQKL